MIPDSSSQTYLIPPRLKAKYSNFKLVSEDTYYKCFEATATRSNQKCMIRTLDTDSKFFHQDPSRAATLFVRELLYLSAKFGGKNLISIEELEIDKEKIAIAMQPNHPVIALKKKTALQPTINWRELLNSMISEINFLRENMKVDKIALNSQNIIRFEKSQDFFMKDWALHVQNSESSPSQTDRHSEEDASKDIQQLGLLMLTLKADDPTEIQDLIGKHGFTISATTADSIEMLIEKTEDDFDLKELMMKMITSSPSKKVMFEDIRKEIEVLKTNPSSHNFPYRICLLEPKYPEESKKHHRNGEIIG